MLHVPTHIFQRDANTARTVPILNLPLSYSPTIDPRWRLKRYTGRTLDRIIGLLWSLIWVVGLGNPLLGISNVVLALGAWTYHRLYITSRS